MGQEPYMALDKELHKLWIKLIILININTPPAPWPCTQEDKNSRLN